MLLLLTTILMFQPLKCDKNIWMCRKLWTISWYFVDFLCILCLCGLWQSALCELFMVCTTIWFTLWKFLPCLVSVTGDAARPFQRTRYYDSTLTALVRTGVRLLWSDGVEESACLLADLTKLEQRKGQGITVPLEVKGQHRQQALQLYLSLPSVNYVHALSMSHNFKSIAHLINR